MAGAFLSAIAVLMLLALMYVGGLVVVRRTAGDHHQALYNAVGQVILAIILDFMVLYFSISFCTSSIKDALRLRGAGQPNMLLESVSESFGGGGIDIATLWGLIIPAISWTCAHAVVLGGLMVSRYAFAVLTAYASRTNADEGRRLTPELLHIWGRAAGYVALLALALYAFARVVTFDTLLVQYQIINSSRYLKKLLGIDWMAHLSHDQLMKRLGGTFVGQVVVHAGTFYVITLLVAAFVVVVALHNLLESVRRLPRRPYQPRPPSLPPDSPRAPLARPVVGDAPGGPSAGPATPPTGMEPGGEPPDNDGEGPGPGPDQPSDSFYLPPSE